MFDQINLRYSPKLTDVVAQYTIYPTAKSVAEAALSITAPYRHARHAPLIYKINGSTVNIAYPQELCEHENIPQLLSLVAGGLATPEHTIQLNDLHLPKNIVDNFEGPRFGVSGIRWLLGIQKRPLIAASLPLMNQVDAAVKAREALIGGCDMVKDSLHVTSHPESSFSKRLTTITQAVHKAEDQTRHKKAFVPNITAETHEMMRRAEEAAQLGITQARINVGFTGLAALQSVLRHDFGIAIEAAFPTHSTYLHGMGSLPLGKSARLLGADKVTIPNAKGNPFELPWHHIKPSFGVCTITHPGMIPAAFNSYGAHTILELGEGIHQHPHGTFKGAMAASQALEASLKGVSLRDYAKTRPELRAALEKWR